MGFDGIAADEGRVTEAPWKSWALVGATLAFLFVGMVKGIVPFPIDLTILAAVAVVAALVAFPRRFDAARESPITWLLLAITAVFLVRLLPAVSSWGLRKATETIAFGGPAYLAGMAIAGHRDTLDRLAKALAFGAVPLTAYLVIYAATNNPYSFASIGSAGYQLTGLLLGMSMLSAAALNAPWLFAAAALGVGVTGNLSGALFAGVALLFIWGSDRNWASIAKQIGLGLAAWAIYWILVAPPLVIMRILWKISGMILAATGEEVAPEQSAAALDKGGFFGALMVRSLSAMPAQSQRYLVDVKSADRSEYYASAVRWIGENWWIGNGYGVPRYAGELYPHNILLEAAAEGGIIAAGLVAAICILALLYAFRSPLLLVGGMVIMMLLTAMVSGYWGTRLLMFTLGLAAGAVLLPKRLGDKQGP